MEATVRPIAVPEPTDFPIQPASGVTTELPVSAETPEDSVVVPDTPVQAVTEELVPVAYESAQLLDLQLKLFEAECRQTAQRLQQPLWILAGALACGTASLMVLFHALGWALYDFAGLPVSVSLFIVTVLGFTATAIALQVVKKQFQEPRISFEKSRAELMRNFEVLAKIVRNPLS